MQFTLSMRLIHSANNWIPIVRLFDFRLCASMVLLFQKILSLSKSSDFVDLNAAFSLKRSSAQSVVSASGRER